MNYAPYRTHQRYREGVFAPSATADLFDEVHAGPRSLTRRFATAP